MLRWLLLALLLMTVPCVGGELDFSQLRIEDLSRLLDMRERQVLTQQEQLAWWSSCIKTPACAAWVNQSEKQP
jgi:hypothetical protein